jgi:hypothetical protein
LHMTWPYSKDIWKLFSDQECRAFNLKVDTWVCLASVMFICWSDKVLLFFRPLESTQKSCCPCLHQK